MKWPAVPSFEQHLIMLNVDEKIYSFGFKSRLTAVYIVQKHVVHKKVLYTTNTFIITTTHLLFIFYLSAGRHKSRYNKLINIMHNY